MKEKLIGSPVYALYARSEYKWKGTIRENNYQIRTYGDLQREIKNGTVEIREKLCKKSDTDIFDRLVFKTREEAETAIMEKCKGKKQAATWIPVAERLPEKGGYYLVNARFGITIMEFTMGNERYMEKPSFVSELLGRCNSEVTHWMPLPDAPKDGDT